MIFALFILGCLFAFAAFCGLATLGYRSRAHSAEVRANRAEGALDESRGHVEAFRALAENAILVAAEANQIEPEELGLGEPPPLSYDVQIGQGDRVIAEYKVENNYVAAIVAFCPSCNVSVRHDPQDYPVKCPRVGCGTLIDPTFDNPPEFDIP